MADRLGQNPEELRQMARQLRERASEAVLPGYATQLIHAAEDLEKQAELLEKRAR